MTPEILVQPKHKRMIVMMFGSPGCGPCVRTKPIVTAVCEETGAGLAYYDTKLEAHRAMAQEHGFKHIPAVLVLDLQGTVLHRLGVLQLNRTTLTRILSETAPVPDA